MRGSDTIAGPRTVSPDVVLYRGIGMCLGNLSKRVISGKIRRVEEDFEVHHVVDDDLNTAGLSILSWSVS